MTFFNTDVHLNLKVILSYEEGKGTAIFSWVYTKGEYALLSFQRDYYRLNPMTSGQASNSWWLDDDIAGIEESFDDSVDDKDINTLVNMAHELLQFHLLTPTVRMYMELHYICGWTGIEIARVLGLDKRNVHQQIINGRKRLVEFAITDEMKAKFENCYITK